MSILKIPFYSALDSKLEDIWDHDGTPEEWTDFIKELDKNIIDVEVITNDYNETCIKFGKEEHISWFALRWT